MAELKDECPYSKDKSYRGYAITDFVMDLQFWNDEWLKDKMSYMLVCEETCPKTGQLHWQCFIYYPNKSKYSAVIKRFAPRHIGYIYATPLDNQKYCKKGDQSKKEYRKLGVNGPNYGRNCKIILEKGECPQQGQRTDLEEIYERIKKNEIKTDVDLAEANINTYVQYGKPLKILIDAYRPDRTWKTEVWCFVGEGGSGKSRLARKMCPGVKSVKLSGDVKNPFILGYEGAPEHVMIEEFNPDSCTQEWWLEATDRYDMPVNLKGGSTKWTPRTIIFTSNKHPSTWWGGWNKQIRRRFTSGKIFKVSIPEGKEPVDIWPDEVDLVLDLDGNVVSQSIIKGGPKDDQALTNLSEDLAKGIQEKDGYTHTVH